MVRARAKARAKARRCLGQHWFTTTPLITTTGFNLQDFAAVADAAPAGSPEAAAAASAAEQIEALTSKSTDSPLTVEMEAALATIAANPDLYHEAPEVRQLSIQL